MIDMILSSVQSINYTNISVNDTQPYNYICDTLAVYTSEVQKFKMSRSFSLFQALFVIFSRPIYLFATHFYS